MAIDQHITDVIVRGDRAVVTGLGSLTYRVGIDPDRTQHSWFANMLVRQPDGRWLMTRRIWADLSAPGAL